MQEWRGTSRSKLAATLMPAAEANWRPETRDRREEPPRGSAPPAVAVPVPGSESQRALGTWHPGGRAPRRVVPRPPQSAHTPCLPQTNTRTHTHRHPTSHTHPPHLLLLPPKRLLTNIYNCNPFHVNFTKRFNCKDWRCSIGLPAAPCLKISP